MTKSRSLENAFSNEFFVANILTIAKHQVCEITITFPAKQKRSTPHILDSFQAYFQVIKSYSHQFVDLQKKCI